MVSDGDSFAPPVRRRMGRGVAFLTAASAAFVVSGYAVNVWLGRLLGPEEYGRFAVVVAVMTLLNVLQNASVPQALARSVARDRRNAPSQLRLGLVLQLGFGMVLAAALFLGASLVSELLGDRRLEEPFRAAAVVIPPYGAFTLLVAYQNGLAHHGRQAAAQVTYAVAKVLGAIGLAYPLRATGGVFGYAVAAVAGTLVVMARPQGGPSQSRARDLMAFAGPHAAYALATMGQFSVDVLLVMAIGTDASAAGVYAAGQSIARIPYFMLTGVAVLILPAVAAAIRGDRRSATTTVRQALRLSFVSVLPLAGIVIGTAGGSLELLYGERYDHGAAILAVLSVGMAALAIGSVGGAALSGLGRPARSAAYALVGLGITTGGSLLMVPAFGAIGAAASMSSGAVVSLVLLLAQLARLLPGAVPLASVLRALVVGACLALALAALSAEGLGLIMAGGASLAAAAGALVALGEIRRADLDRARDIVRGEA